ncbi:MAG: hypothetical protein RLZZ244_1306 [Verrucomicrobiota bacterium]|jgi:hypothetical protein
MIPPPSSALSRRHFLRAAGVTLALPWLETFSRAANPTPIQRFVCVANPFGMIHDAFFPTEEGLAAALPRNLAPFDPLRGKFTVFSNLDHGYRDGHGATHTLLSGVKSSEVAAMPEGNISLDQFLARQVASETRFPVLNTAAGPVGGGGVELCWTRTGVMVPPIQQVSRVFKLLFLDDPADQIAARRTDYEQQGSILDALRGQAKSLNQRISSRDREKLDQYLTAIREVEKSVSQEKSWLSRPRARVDAKEPKDGTVSQQLPILFDLVALALQTDSTRVATIEIPGSFDTSAMGIEEKGYHGYSHHGKDPVLMEGMRKVEAYQMLHLARFLTKLEEFGLLDTTQVLFGSGMGDGSAHTNKSLPILLAGGGYPHRTHVRMPEEKEKRVPLCDLYLSMAQRFGVETHAFGKSKGTFSALA